MEYLYDVPKEKISVVSPGVDTALFHPMKRTDARVHIQANPNHKIVLFVGRIEPLKGIDTLIYAIKILKQQYPKETICLWIVGGDSSKTTGLTRLQKTLGLHSSIRFVGRQKQTELPQYYNAADVVVMPSHYESFGMSALEALACGVPVIATNVAGVSAYTSLVTSVNNPLLLASQIQKVLTHTPQTVGTDTFLAKHQWSRVAQSLISLYTSVIRGA